MPFKSEAQRKWAHTPEGTKALGGAEAVAEWERASQGLKLPERVTAPKASKPGSNPLVDYLKAKRK